MYARKIERYMYSGSKVRKSNEDGMYPGRSRKGKYVGGYLSWEVSGYSHGFDADAGLQDGRDQLLTLTGNRRVPGMACIWLQLRAHTSDCP